MLTVADRESIAGLYAEYDAALSSHDEMRWLALWTPDGALDGGFAGQGGARSPASFFAMFTRRDGSHHRSTVLSLSGDGRQASTECEISMGFESGGAARTVTAIDDLIKVDLTWRLHRRRMERRAQSQTFDRVYEGSPVFDIGRPQQAVVELADAGHLHGRVLDVGCGTGENALYLASHGCDAVGIDFSQVAIEKAQDKARSRGIPARFIQWDALQVDQLGQTFDLAIECGVFHCFSAQQRREHAASLRSALVPAGRLYLIDISERETGSGPPRVSVQDVQDVFSRGWTIEMVQPGRIETNFPDHVERGGAEAWIVCLARA